eukprot:gene8134-biopygen7602
MPAPRPRHRSQQMAYSPRHARATVLPVSCDPTGVTGHRRGCGAGMARAWPVIPGARACEAGAADAAEGGARRGRDARRARAAHRRAAPGGNRTCRPTPAPPPAEESLQHASVLFPQAPHVRARACVGGGDVSPGEVQWCCILPTMLIMTRWSC